MLYSKVLSRIGLIIASIIVLWVAVPISWDLSNFLINAKPANAQVVEILHESTPPDFPLRRGIHFTNVKFKIIYTPTNNKIVETETTIRYYDKNRDSADYLGTTIPILYNQKDHKDVVVNDLQSFWLTIGSFVFLVLGSLVLIIDSIVRLVKLRSKSKT